MDKKLIEAQMGFLTFRKPNEVAETLSDYKLLYKRAALINHQREEGSGDTQRMQTLNEWRERVNLYFANNDRLAMPQGADIDVVEMPTSVDPLRYADVPSFKSLDTLVSEAFKVVKIDRLFELSNKFDREYFDKERQLCIGYTQGYMGHVYLQDITNAFESKLQCVSYNIEVSDVLDKHLSMQDYQDARCSIVLFNFFDDVVGTDEVSSLWTWLESLDGFDEYGRKSFEFGVSVVTVTKRSEKGSKVFSPFKLNKFKPISKLPPKPTKSHMMKLLVNGQYSHLKDDYYYDPDYGSGYLEKHGEDSGYGINPLSYARKLFNGRASASFGTDCASATIRITSNEWKTVSIKLCNRFLAEDVQRDDIAGLI